MSTPAQKERAKRLAQKAIAHGVMADHQLQPWLKTIELLPEAEAELSLENMQTAIEARISGLR